MGIFFIYVPDCFSKMLPSHILHVFITAWLEVQVLDKPICRPELKTNGIINIKQNIYQQPHIVEQLKDEIRMREINLNLSIEVEVDFKST